MKSNRPTVLFVPHMDTSLLEMLDIAQALEEQGEYRPIYLIHWDEYQRAVDICNKHGIGFILHGVKELNTVETHNESPQAFGKNEIKIREHAEREMGLQSVFSWMISKIKRLFLPQLLLYLFRFYRFKVNTKSLLRDLEPICLLFMSDRHVGLETALIDAANNVGLPSLIVPFALSESSGLAEYRLAQPDWQKIYGMTSWMNRLFVRKKPSWSYVFEGNSLLWNGAAWMVAAEIMGMMPEYPWSLGGGKAWTMAVESEYNKENFEEQGTPASKMIITGKPRYDRAADVWKNQRIVRAEICNDLGLDPGKPLLICAVPQLAEHDFLPWPEHWVEIEFLFDHFSELQPEINTVLSLHPKSDFDKYAPRAEKYGLVIAQEHSYDQLIPISDVFVATHSSTVTLAIAAQKPTIIVDFYGLDYHLFNDIPGIEVVREHEKFPPILARIFSDQAYYDRLVDGQIQSAKRFARFDGKATERILILIDELIVQSAANQKLPKREMRKSLPSWSQ